MTSYAEKHLDVYCRGMDSAVWHKWYLNNKWSNWQSLGGKWLYEPVVITRKNYKVDVFCIGTDCALYYKNFDGKRWGDWIKIGGVCIGPPAVTSRDGTDIIDVVVMGTDHSMWHRWMSKDTKKWYPESNYERWGGEFTHQLTGCTWGNDHNSFLGVGINGTCYEKRWLSGKGWLPFVALPGKWTGTPRACTVGKGIIEVIGLNEKSSLNHVHAYESKQNWSTGIALGGTFQSTPDVVSWDGNRMDILCVGMDSSVYHKQWSSQGGWKDWYSLKGIATNPCRAVSWGKNNLNVFCTGTNFHLFLKWFKGERSWGPSTDGAWEDLGGVLSSMPGGRA